MRALVNYVRAIRPIAGPGIRTRETPNGTILSCPVKANPARPTPVDLGCWKIVVATRDEEDEETGETVTKPVRQFANQFYMDGEYNMHELELDDAVEDFVCQGEPGEGEEYTADDRPFVCLKVPATTDSEEDPTLVGFADIEELQEAQKAVAYVLKPLYKFTHDGAVAVDFRNCPTLQVSEVLP